MMEHFFDAIDGFSWWKEQGELLNIMLSEIQFDKLKVAEIGVYKGRLTAMWAVALINKGIDFEYHAVDHFLGSAEHDSSFDYYKAALSNLHPILDKIIIQKNESTAQAATYPDNYFDIVYIDGSHDYESVMADIKAWTPKIKPGGFICGDDYEDSRPGVFLVINECYGDKINVFGIQWYIKI
jgi:hypothetical protein